MKRLIVAILFLLTGAFAQAEKITLQPVGCGTLKQCTGVPNNSTDGSTITIYGAPSYNFYYIDITVPNADPTLPGVTTEYYANVPSSTDGDVSLQSFYFPQTNPFNPAVKVFTGIMITANLTWSSYRTCNRSGRGGGYCVVHWNLTGGTITR